MIVLEKDSLSQISSFVMWREACAVSHTYSVQDPIEYPLNVAFTAVKANVRCEYDPFKLLGDALCPCLCSQDCLHDNA